MAQDLVYGRFDQVALLTTTGVDYLSERPGADTGVGGVWTVAGAVADKLLLTKGETVIRIPATDVKLVRKHDLKHLADALRGVRKARQ